MTDPTGEALLAAIAAEPDEDTPRLAYADYLDELGGELAAARAEFVRLQVMLAQVNSETHETISARVRVVDLREQYSDAWGWPVQNESKQWYTVRRGFVERLTIPPQRIPRADVLQLLQAEPVGLLQVERLVEMPEAWWAPPSGTPEWIDVAAFRRVRHLELSGSYWTDRELARLLAFRNFPSLLRLTLNRTPITGAAAAAIANCERLRELMSLRIDDTRHFNSEVSGWTGGVPTPGVKALAGSSLLAGLRELSLRTAGIETAGAFSLADSPHLDGLQSLDLTGNPGIGLAGREALIVRFGPRVKLSPQ